MRSFWALFHDALNNPPLRVREPQRSFYPSGAGITVSLAGGLKIRHGGCARQSAYHLLGYPEMEEPDTIGGVWAREAGTVFTQILKRKLEKAWLIIDDETRISVLRTTPKGRQYYISGRIDLIVRDPETNRPMFVEAKTKMDFMDAGIITSKPATKYSAAKPLAPAFGDVCQAMIYMDWARRELGLEDPETWLIYATRGVMKYSEHILRFGKNDILVAENTEGVKAYPEVSLGGIYADIDATMDHVADGTLPDRSYTLQWSHDRIMHEYQSGLLNKEDHETVAARIRKNESPLLDKGDKNCTWCPFAYGCQSATPPVDFKPQVKRSTLTLVSSEPVQEDHHTDADLE